MTHVAHEHQRTARQRDGVAVSGLPSAVGVQLTGEGFAAFLDGLFQVTLHQAEPVAVHTDFIFRIHRCHGVFAVHDGGQRGFNHDVFDVCRVGLADGVAGVDLDFQVQAVVGQQNRFGGGSITVKTNQLASVF